MTILELQDRKVAEEWALKVPGRKVQCFLSKDNIPTVVLKHTSQISFKPQIFIGETPDEAYHKAARWVLELPKESPIYNKFIDGELGLYISIATGCIQRKQYDHHNTFDVYISVINNGAREWRHGITPMLREAAERLISAWVKLYEYKI